MSRYPQECPVFEVVFDGYETHPFAVGDVAVGFPYVDGCEMIWLERDNSTGALHSSMTGALIFPARQVRPLTRAAREMLALVLL